MKQSLKTLVWITLFAIAMGYLESAVVIYLRSIIYPGGFQFPMAPIDPHLAITEIFREVATMLMLLGIGYIAGRTFTERFAWFIYSFAIWDIFYYVFLKLLIGWPGSFMTWDILFLIPATWVGPVIAPLIVSITMIGLGLILIYYSKTGKIIIVPVEWILLIAGSLALIVAFIWDYAAFILRHFSYSELWNMPDRKPLYDLGMQYTPVSFNWMLFSLGEILIIAGIILIILRIRKQKHA